MSNNMVNDMGFMCYSETGFWCRICCGVGRSTDYHLLAAIRAIGEDSW